MTTKEDLVRHAATLPLPAQEAAPAFKAAGPAMIRRVESELFARSDLEQLIGLDNLSMVENNHANHVRYLASLLAAFDPASFVEIVHWVYRTYTAHGASPRYWEIALPLWKQALEEEAPAEVREILDPVYDFLIRRHQDFVQLSSQKPTYWEQVHEHP
ncbi:MAG: hypothetical protein ACOCVM_09130 [Desulfovibrionaceae bacterium]